MTLLRQIRPAIEEYPNPAFSQSASSKGGWFACFFLSFLAVLGLLAAHRLFSSCREPGLLSSHRAQASDRGGFSCCRTQPLGCSGFSSCGSWALEHRLNSCGAWA